MHELSIAAALVEQVDTIIAKEHAYAATRVTVTVGGLSGVCPEALELAFPVAAEGTTSAGAELVITHIEVAALP